MCFSLHLSAPFFSATSLKFAEQNAKRTLPNFLPELAVGGERGACAVD